MRTIRIVTTVILVAITAVGGSAQAPADTWRAVAEDVGLGSEVNVRLSDGRRVRATLVGVRDDVVLLQPRTRVPVPVQPVSYSEIVSLERRGKGIGTGKAVAIGVATGVGALFGMMAIMVALVGD
jgi:hypothetical protein